MKKINTIINCVTLCSLLFVYPSFSEEKKDSSDIRSYNTEELMILAPKDAKNILIQPSSISLIEAEAITRNGATSLKDFTAIAPNFFMPDYGTKLTSPVYIRGIGSRINSPSVGLNVDNAPYFEKAAFDFDLFGIERIEILRGPQGTLYGRNTMGGIINIFTKSPLKHQGTEAFVNANNYNMLNVGANHFGSLTKTFGYSIGMVYKNEDGYFTNSFNNKKPDASTTIGSRMRLIHKPTDYFTFENITSFETSKQNGYPYAKYDKTNQSIVGINYNEDSYYDRDMFSNAFIFKVDTKDFELISTSSYQLLKDINAIDQDFTPDSLYYVTQWQNQHVLSQELVMKSKYDEKYEWLFGAYGFYQNFNNQVDVKYYKAKSLTVKEYFHDIYGGALFHQSSLNNFLIDKFSVIGGIRMDFETDAMDYKASSTVNNVFKQTADTTYSSLNSFQIMPKVSFKYELSMFTHFYSTISRGYKTGGFNSTFERPEDLNFDPEQSWNYEVGMKLNLLQGDLYADMALFYIDWTNQQIYQTVPSGRGSMLKNAGQSTSKGLEFSLNANPFEDFETNFSFGYTDAKFDEHIVDSTKNFSGNYIPYVPEFTMSVNASKLFRMSGFLEGIRINGQYKMTGKHYWSEKNDSYQDAYGLLDFSVSFITEYVSLDFWVKNVTNEVYSAFYFEALGNSFVQQGRPSNFGLRLSAKI